MTGVEILTFIVVILGGLLYMWRGEWKGIVASVSRAGGLHALHLPSTTRRQGNQAAGSHEAPLYTVYADGSCEPDPGPGGWAYVVVGGDNDVEASGEHQDTTAMRMELTAAIMGLEATAPGSTVQVHTDSQVVQQAMTGWIHRWMGNGWRTSSGQPVENEDLWASLWEVAEERSVQWVWHQVDLAMATGRDMPANRAHALAHSAMRHAAAGVDGEPGGRLLADVGAPVSAADQQGAFMAECEALERRWAELHEEVLRLDHEWQRLLGTATSGLEARRNGQPPSWAGGALLFHHLHTHAAHMSTLATEALHVCDRYGKALQRAMAGAAKE